MSIPLELLAPAGSAAIGIAAIDHGADAVYIGAPRFSARARAGRTLAEIEQLIDYARLFHARVYVTLNTILDDREIPQALEIIRAVEAIGADALIVQDPGLLELELPPIPLFASTQMHNVTPEQVEFLQRVGFQRVILARELSLAEIAAIRARTAVELEAFVHGALCVSYSGQCYMSQFACGRSANRGLCAQPCRHAYTLVDGEGKTVVRDKHLLSLKDLKRLDAIAELVAAGVTSFKIEGRYKESSYVKNITAAYRLALDRFLAEHPGYCRAASGSCAFPFQPDPEKTFNRGYTSFFLRREREKPAALDTPKSIGQLIGKVTAMGRDFIRLGNHDLQNGDGLCFFTPQGTLAGCRVNLVGREKIYPDSMQDLAVGTVVYRNFNAAFCRALQHSARCRTLAVEMAFSQTEGEIRLTVSDEDGVSAGCRRELPFVPARDPERARAAVRTQLARTGDTPYRVAGMVIEPPQPGFVPLSLLNELRRQALASLTRTRRECYRRRSAPFTPNRVPCPDSRLDYRANVLNDLAEKFYARHGALVRERAWESAADPAAVAADRPVMVSRYCLRYQLDACLKSAPGKSRRHLPPPLRIFDRGHGYRLEFDCRECRMSVIPEATNDYGPKVES